MSMITLFRTAYLRIAENSLSYQIDFIVFGGTTNEEVLANMDIEIEKLKLKYPNHRSILLSPISQTETIGDMPYITKLNF